MVPAPLAFCTLLSPSQEQEFLLLTALTHVNSIHRRAFICPAFRSRSRWHLLLSFDIQGSRGRNTESQSSYWCEDFVSIQRMDRKEGGDEMVRNEKLQLLFSEKLKGQLLITPGHPII